MVPPHHKAGPEAAEHPHSRSVVNVQSPSMANAMGKHRSSYLQVTAGAQEHFVWPVEQPKQAICAIKFGAAIFSQSLVEYEVLPPLLSSQQVTTGPSQQVA